MNILGRRGEGGERNAHDIVVAHRPGQLHQQPPDRQAAPIHEQCVVQRGFQADLQLVRFGEARRKGNLLNIADGAPGNETETVDENAVLPRADPRLAFLKRVKILGDASRRRTDDQKRVIAGREEHAEGQDGQNRHDIETEIARIAAIREMITALDEFGHLRI